MQDTHEISIFSRFSKILAVTLIFAIVFVDIMPSAAQEKASDVLLPIAPSKDNIPSSRAQIQLSFAPLVKMTAPAVVNIYAARQIRSQSPFAGDPFFEQFFGRQFGGGRPRIQSSLGSGVIVDSSGLVVTNNHVIKDADDIKIALSDGQEFESRVLLKDDTTDLAILKIDAKQPFPILTLGNSDNVEVGDLVLAIGNPFGVGQTVTSGIVSAQARTHVGINDFDFFIQTDAAINPGNSGGALIDMRGHLIGINTAIYSRSGGSIGLGFAIPSNMVRVVIETALKGGKNVERPFIGATFQPVTADVAESLGLLQPYGALITTIEDNQPAQKAGLKVGDVILSIDGVRIDNPDILTYRILTTGIGNKVRLTIFSHSKQRDVTVVLEKAPEIPETAVRIIDDKSPLSGAEVLDLTPSIAQQFHLPDHVKGVIVSAVYRNSSAARLNLQRGDIIRKVNGTQISTTDVLVSVLADDVNLVWRFEFERNGTIIRQYVR